MRVLAHIHTMNDEAVIEQALEGLRRQTRPPDAIVIVDNASIDSTLDRTFPETATILRNPVNLGTSGTIRIGFDHALRHGFDWTWVFDADTVPEPDALEKLLVFYEQLSTLQQQRVCFLAGWPLRADGEAKQPAMSLAGETLEFIPFTSCTTALSATTSGVRQAPRRGFTGWVHCALPHMKRRPSAPITACAT
jgi:glycosyltransferase involved in cell wall biosynthesis